MTISTHSFNTINVGTSANDGTGDDLRTAFIKLNDNFQWMGNTGFTASNVVSTGSVQVNQTLTAQGNVVIGNNYKPSSNTSAGTAGQIVWSNGNIYVCVATNTWMRAALTSTF